MSGGGSNKQTTSSSSEPWKAAQPALQQSLTGAQNVYNNPSSFQPYPNSTVVPYSAMTGQAQNELASTADNAQYAMNDQLSRVYQNSLKNGLTDTQRGVMGRLTGQATGAFNPNENPGFQSVLKQALDSAGNAVDMGASAAGRYGSGTHQGVAGKTAGDIAGTLTSNEYNDYKNRRDAANTSLFNAGQQQQQNIWGNTGALSDAYQASMAPAQTKMGIGGQFEDLAGRQMNDAMRIWQGQQQAPKSAVEWLNAIGSGAGSLGSTSGTSSQGPKANPWGQAAGGLLGLNSLLGGGF
jgi:hypothetical protein